VWLVKNTNIATGVTSSAEVAREKVEFSVWPESLEQETTVGLLAKGRY